MFKFSTNLLFKTIFMFFKSTKVVDVSFEII